MKDQNAFKQKLYNHTIPAPEDLWTRIESKLPSEKKRFPFFWMSLATAVVISGAGILWQVQDNKVGTTTIIPKENIHHKTIKTPEASALFSETKESTEIVVSGGSIKKENTPNTISVAPSKNSNTIFILQNQRHLGNSISSNTELSESSIENLSQNSTSTNQTNSGAFLSRSSAIAAYTTAPLPFTDVSLRDAEEGSINASIDAIKPDPSCYKFTGDDAPSPLSVDLFAGPGFSPRSFENTSGETQLYAQAREATEHNQYAFSAGGRVNYRVRHDLGLSVGIMYEQIGDIFDYRDTSAFQTSLRVDSFFSANGQFLYADTNYVLIVGTLIKKIHNRYHHLDVPLLISYQLPMGRTLVMVNAGPVINLTTSFRGQILDPNLAPRQISPEANNNVLVYKRNVGLSLWLGAGILFPLTDNISAMVEPRYLYRINPVTLDGYPLKEHRHYAGLNLGIRYQFN